MVWIDPDGNFLVRGKMAALPDHMHFRLEDGTLVAGGYSYDVIDADGTIRERYREPIPYAVDDVEGVDVFLVCGDRFCRYHWTDRWGRDAVDVTCDVLLEGLQPYSAADLPFDPKRSRRAYGECIERKLRETEREKIRHEQASLAEFSERLPHRDTPVEVVWRYENVKQRQVIVCFGDGTPIWRGTHRFLGKNLFRSFKEALRNRYGSLFRSFKAELNSFEEGMAFDPD